MPYLSPKKQSISPSLSISKNDGFECLPISTPLKGLSEPDCDVNIDEQRLNQEIVILAEKRDISEEITRLKSHIDLFKEFLSESNKQVGKKMNFLLQEMGREVNTIGSKTDLIQVSHLVVSLKNEIEKIREQVQNIL